MSEGSDNIDTIHNEAFGYNIIRTAIIGALALAGSFGMVIVLYAPEHIAIGATLVGSAITGAIGFIAGRKS